MFNLSKFHRLINRHPVINPRITHLCVKGLAAVSLTVKCALVSICIKIQFFFKSSALHTILNNLQMTLTASKNQQRTNHQSKTGAAPVKQTYHNCLKMVENVFKWMYLTNIRATLTDILYLNFAQRKAQLV